MKSFLFCFLCVATIHGFAQTDSLALYHPLHIGNEWIYKQVSSTYSIGFPPTVTSTTNIIHRTITHDSTIEGVRWFIVQENNLTNKTTQIALERYDSVSTNYYINDELMDSTQTISQEKIFGHKIFDSKSLDTVLGHQTTSRNIASPLTSVTYKWKFSYGFGLTLKSVNINDFPPTNYSTTTSLVYTKINGKEYGTKAILYADSLSHYHPLHNGNEWVYKHTEYNSPNPPTVSYITKTVVGDTILNGKVYKIIEEKNGLNTILWHSFERFDDVTGNYIRFHKELNKEFVEDSTFTSTLLDIFGDPLTGKQLTHVYSGTVLDSSTQIRSLKNVDLIIHQNLGWKYASGFGLIEKYEAEYTIYSSLINKDELVYAKINGKEFGTKAILYADSLSQYHPLHNGNEWVYKHTTYDFPNPPIVSYFTKTVIGDTLLGGEMYKVIQKKNNFNNGIELGFERFDEATGNYIHFINNPPMPWVEDSTFTNTPDETFSGPYRQRKLNKIYGDTILAVQSQIREINTTNHVSESDRIWRYAYGFGLVYEHLAGVYPSPFIYILDKLVYAKINGTEYGTNPLSVERIDDKTPLTFSLSQNFPNPFNPTTKILFTLPQSSRVTLKIYDILGKEIETLVDEQKEAGTFSAQFLASRLSSGIYFYQIRAGGFIQTRKMIYSK